MPDDCMLFLQKNKDMFLSFFHGKMLINLKSATHHVQHIYFLHLLHLCDNIIHRTFDDIIINLCKLLWRNRHSRLDPCNYNIAHGLGIILCNPLWCQPGILLFLTSVGTVYHIQKNLLHTALRNLTERVLSLQLYRARIKFTVFSMFVKRSTSPSLIIPFWISGSIGSSRSVVMIPL